MSRNTRFCWIAVCVLILLTCGRRLAEDFAPVVREASFAAGGVVILDANVGDVRVMPTDQEGKLRLVITSHKQEDATAAPHWVREFAVNGSQAKIVLEMPKHGEHNFDVTIYVPKQSDLRLNLEVGDLTIDRHHRQHRRRTRCRRSEDDSARSARLPRSRHVGPIGDVHAGAFGLEPHGFLGKSVEREFSAGSYRLKLHTGIGDVSCTAGGA